ncbi:MAG: hypothetical protein IID14_07855 [Candidatus Marinimicrobia bacterium]|nr:hypothetical protein [Candidatus Neomarinimicrobiota bacterium]
MELGQGGQASTGAGTVEPGATQPGAITPRQQLTQSLRSLTTPAPPSGSTGGVVTIPVGLNPVARPASGGVRLQRAQGPRIGVPAAIDSGDTGSRRNVPLAASFAETALGNTPGAREDILAPAARPVPSADASPVSRRFTLGGNGPARQGITAPEIQPAQGAIGGIQERTTNPGPAFGPAARVVDRLSNPGPGGSGGGALNAPRIENAGPAIGGVGDGPGLTGRQNLGAGISPGIPANRGANPERGGITPILTPRTPGQITPETPRGGLELATITNANAEAPTINRAADETGPASAAVATDLGLDADNIPGLAPRTPAQIAADAPLNGQEGAATINAGIPDAAQRQTPDAVGPASAAVATDLDLGADNIPALAPRTPREIAADAPRGDPEGAAVISPDTVLAGTGGSANLLIGLENELDLEGAIVRLTPEAPGDVAETAVPLPGLPEEETPGIATSLAREDEELFEAIRAPAAVGADRELRNAGENPQTIGAAAEEAFRAPQGPAEATGPVQTNTVPPERLAGPEPVEADDREPEATERANNPEVAPPTTAVAEGPAPAPAPEPEALTAAPDNPADLAAEPPAPIPGARPDENSPAGQEALVARAVAAFEAQQFEGRSNEPVETRALEELFI